MQSRFTVAILVLQVEGLVSSSGYVSFILQYVPTVIIAEPNQISFIIGHLSRDADLVAVEVVGLLDAFAFFVGPVVYLCVPHMPYVRIESFMRATNLLIHLHKHHHSFEKKNLTKTILFHLKPIFPVVL